MTNRNNWTSLFRRKVIAGEDFLSSFLAGISRIFEGGSEGEALIQLRSELRRIFDCDDVSIFTYEPDEVPRPEEGEWVLTVSSGFGEGNRVCQADALETPSLVPGKHFPYSEDLAKRSVLKAVALSFQEDAFYGCDIEKKIVLLKDPSPEDDLGSGDLSVLAIPLNYHHRVGRVLEKRRVGVLALYRTPTRRNVGELQQFLRSILAHAITAPTCLLRDPVTTLYSEDFLREQLDVQMNQFQLADGKLRGGLVVGMIDTLKIYKQTLESEVRIDPELINHRISDVLHGVGTCVWRRARRHTMAGGSDYRCGCPGRIGHEGFGVILPLLKPIDQKMWAIRLGRDVVEFPFSGEEYLVSGDVTISQRVIPFGFKGANTAEQVWALAQAGLEEIELAQIRARRDPIALAETVGTIRTLLKDGSWASPQESRGMGEL